MPLIVGGGVVGASAALELARRGHSVTLADPGPLPHPAAASTDISKIVRADYGDDELYTELGELALEGWRRWNEEWGEPLFHETGLAILSSRSLDEPGFEGDSFRTLCRRGHALERLNAAAIADRFPRFRPGRFRDGYYNSRGGWVESGRVVARLIEAGRALGVSVREGLPISSLEGLDANPIVVCAGAWTPALVPELADRIRAVAQPVLCFAPADPARFAAPAHVPWTADIASTGFYGFCSNSDGVVKVANHGPGTVVDPRDEAQRCVAPDVEAKFRAFLADAIPELAHAPIATSRACLYSDSFDGDFFIDRHPDRERLIVASGGSGHAFKFAPVLGGIVADVVERRSNRFASRFAWRSHSARRSEQARFDG